MTSVPGVDHPEEYPLSGVGGANIGPGFAVEEYAALADRSLTRARETGDASLYAGLSTIAAPPAAPADRRTVLGVGPFNLAAGAETCLQVQQAVLDSQTLLDGINFTGSNDYLGSKSKDPKRSQALALAASIDRYNNGSLC